MSFINNKPKVKIQKNKNNEVIYEVDFEVK